MSTSEDQLFTELFTDLLPPPSSSKTGPKIGNIFRKPSNLKAGEKDDQMDVDNFSASTSFASSDKKEPRKRELQKMKKQNKKGQKETVPASHRVLRSKTLVPEPITTLSSSANFLNSVSETMQLPPPEIPQTLENDWQPLENDPQPFAPKTIQEFIEFQAVNTSHFLLGQEENRDIATLVGQLNSLLQENYESTQNIENLTKEYNRLLAVNKKLKEVNTLVVAGTLEKRKTKRSQKVAPKAKLVNKVKVKEEEEED